MAANLFLIQPDGTPGSMPRYLASDCAQMAKDLLHTPFASAL